MMSACASASAGSSPHAWGIPAGHGLHLALDRFIPTCVGNTCQGQRSCHHKPVHPHMRGEYAGAHEVVQGHVGSSPHAWGIRSRPKTGLLVRRFIPTCVGNTWPARNPRESPSVHPHMRGEYGGRERLGWDSHGSSPHAWGIQIGSETADMVFRFIPTCVGNTTSMVPETPIRPVHPHMRGEYAIPSWNSRPIFGSSPHAWGIHARMQAGSIRPRFIPTCVGNTGLSSISGIRTSVHPHMRGEYCCYIHLVVQSAGSSPHAWGILPCPDPALFFGRFIPTCVGNTGTPRPHVVPGAVHPHMRGEYCGPTWTP